MTQRKMWLVRGEAAPSPQWHALGSSLVMPLDCLEEILDIEDVIGSDTRIIHAASATSAVTVFEIERDFTLYGELPGGFSYYRGNPPRYPA